MTSPTNLFEEAYGYQFQNGDNWDDMDSYVDNDYWIALAADGSRRIIDWQRIFFSPTYYGKELYDRNPGLPIHYGRALVELEGSFLGYDWANTVEQVNQVLYLQAFKSHAATFAHQLDAAMGHHSLASADEADRLAIYHTLKDAIASGWQRYAIWEAVDPEELIIGGVYDGTLLWKRDQADYEEADRRLCGECDIATFARRAYFHANIPLAEAAASPGHHPHDGPEHRPLGRSPLWCGRRQRRLRRPGCGFPRRPTVL